MPAPRSLKTTVLSSGLSSLLLLLSSPHVHAASSYTLARTHQGANFFDGWQWYGRSDNLTQGSVDYVTRATSSELAYLNSANNAVLKVDNTTVLPSGQNRKSVRLQSIEAYNQGTLLIFDALHMPYGCSVWPAWWTVASDSGWPVGGEIDIMENINGQTVNQMALHTLTGCMADGTSATQTGPLTFNNCSTEANYDTGCTVAEPNQASYGAAFAHNGGGVFATEFATEGIKMWFFSRDQVPADINVRDTSIVPNPSTWGLPTAFYANSACAWNTFFGPQRATLDITLCGAWAGVPETFSKTCTGNCTDLVMDPTNYDTAYFEISGITMWCADGINCATTDPALAALEGSTSTTSAAAGSAVVAVATSTKAATSSTSTPTAKTAGAWSFSVGPASALLALVFVPVWILV